MRNDNWFVAARIAVKEVAKRYRRQIIVAAVCVLAMIIVVVVGLAASRSARGSAEPVSIVLVHDLQSEAVVTALGRELAEYTSLFPDVPVSMQRGLDGDGDVFVLPAYPETIVAWAGDPVPWSGNLWVLAARRDRLDELAAAAPGAVQALRSGAADPAGFESILAAAKKSGLGPITLGNSHGWPFTLWLQFWAAASLGPDAVMTMPPRSSSPYPALGAAVDDLHRWRGLGWFDEKAWSQGWAQGLAPLDDGEAVFAILSEAQLTALSPAARGMLEFLPFPRRAGDAPWTIGSAMYLARPASQGRADAGRSGRKAVAARTAAAENLVRYLSSPGVTSRLAKSTGRPFFAWNPESGKAPTVIGAWYDRVDTPDFQALAEYLAGK